MNLGRNTYVGDTPNYKRSKLVAESSLAPVSVSNNDNIYWNIIITNTGTTVAPVNASVTYTQSLTTDGTQRYLSLIRFTLDGSTIPIFFWDVDTTDADPNAGLYTVTIRNPAGLGTDVTVKVKYDPSYVQNDWYPGEKPIFSYNSFIDMINVALKAAHDGILGHVVGDHPIMYYNANNGLCGIAVKQTPGSPYPYQIFMNNILYNFFNNFDSKLNPETINGANNPKYAQILVKNYVINSELPVTGYTFVNQEYQSLYLWFDITTIEFVSARLKIRSEFVPTVQIGSQIEDSNAGGGPAASNLLTDFQPTYQPGDQAGPRGYTYYAPGAQYRLIDILDDDVKEVDIQVTLQDRRGKHYQYFLPPLQTLYLKMLLVKKELFK